MPGSGPRRRAALAALWLVAAGSAGAAPIVSVDMEPHASGIQTALTVLPETTFEVDVVVSGVPAPGFNVYVVALGFDTEVLGVAEIFDLYFADLFFLEIAHSDTGVEVSAGFRSFGGGEFDDGPMFRVIFEAAQPGESPIEIQSAVLQASFFDPPVPPPVIGGAGTVPVVPEPATAVLLGLGCAALARARRRATSRRA